MLTIELWYERIIPQVCVRIIDPVRNCHSKIYLTSREELLPMKNNSIVALRQLKVSALTSKRESNQSRLTERVADR